MSHRMLHNLDFARKALLTVAAVLAIAIPVTVGLLNPTPGRAQSTAASATLPAPVFSSVSVKPDESASNQPNRANIMFSLNDGTFFARGVTLQRLIQIAYHVQDSQVSGGPDWLNTAKFDVDAKLDPSFVAAMHQRISDHKDFDDQSMLRALLVGQFKLAAHTQSQTLPVYDLVVDANGPKFQPSTGTQRMMLVERGELTSSGAPIELLAQQLSVRLGQTVVDKTGLKGSYTYTLHWTPDPNEAQRVKQAGQQESDPASPDPNAPSLVSAVQEQLGLKLEPQTAAVPVIVIDHVEAPSAND